MDLPQAGPRDTIWEFFHETLWKKASEVGYDLVGEMYSPMREYMAADPEEWPTTEDFKTNVDARMILAWLLVLVQLCYECGIRSPRIIKVNDSYNLTKAEVS